jgi:hypothetical protein
MAPGRRTAPATARRPLGGTGGGAAPARVANYDGSNTFGLLESFLMSRFLDGSQPFSRAQGLDRLRDEATLMPPGTHPVRSVVTAGRTAHLVEGEGWTLRCVRWSNGGHVEVVAATDELALTVLESAVEGATEELAADDTRVEIGFWHWAGNHARRRALPISAEPWVEIRRNYSSSAATAFDELIALDGTAVNGRILLVHGPPGTGKTTALRSLAKQWREWCQLDFVLDPELLFASPGYLIEVIMGDDHDDKPWRMLLLEDCDELIRPGAKASAGQALSRLLNLTDGLLGQGRQVLVAITTNEDLTRLHPAVTRPGRCLAQIEVGRLPSDQARAWLAASTAGPVAGSVGAKGATLAELIALRDGSMPIGTRDVEPSTVFTSSSFPVNVVPPPTVVVMSGDASRFARRGAPRSPDASYDRSGGGMADESAFDGRVSWHMMLLGLAGRVSDDVLTRCRAWLYDEREAEIAPVSRGEGLDQGVALFPPELNSSRRHPTPSMQNRPLRDYWNGSRWRCMASR